MSQQINLYDPALERRHDPLNLINLAIGAIALAVILGAWAGWTRVRLGDVEAEAQAVASQLKTLQDQNQSLAAQAANLKPSPQLAAELAAARADLDNRAMVLALLSKGLGPGAPSFAEYLRGLARQAASGLWLTGFSVDSETGAMAINGRMLDPAVLPDYIRKLNGEKVFQGRSFSALQLKNVEVPTTPAATAPAAQAAPAPATAPQPAAYSEFLLVPTKEPTPAAGAKP